MTLLEMKAQRSFETMNIPRFRFVQSRSFRFGRYVNSRGVQIHYIHFLNYVFEFLHWEVAA